ncbi:MAG: glycosyltransferase family 4 protein [Planctomycetaceae bacterium]
MADSVERVLMMTHELSFRGSSILALRLAQGLKSRKVETVVLCTRKQALDVDLTSGVRIETVPGYSTPVWGNVVARTVLRNLSEQPPDVIHVQGPQMLAQAIWLGQTLNRPVIVYLTDQSEGKQILLAAQSHPVRAIACVSASVKAALPSRLNLIEQRVILPGVPLDVSDPVAPILQTSRTPVIGMAGPLEVIKGASFFLRACHRVLEAGLAIRIVVAGSGPEERNLRRLATSLELNDHVTFVDDGVAMKAYLSAIDIFCLPSLQQGFGIILLEAMALGRPVIASGVGGILSILEDNKNGMIVPPSDSQALAERMIILLQDAERARHMGMAGRRLVEDRFTTDRMTSDMLALYNDVMAPRAKGPVSVSMTAVKDRHR